MGTNDWGTILKDFLLTSGLLTSAGLFLKRLLDSNRRVASKTAILDAAAIYDELNRLGAAIQADRVMIMYTSNGGGLPNAGKPLYLTVLYEIVRGTSAGPIRNLISKLPIDHNIINMLKKIIADNSWETTDPTKLEPSFMKDLLLASGESRCHITTVHHSKDKYYMLFIGWKGDGPETHETNIHIAASTAKLMNHLKK